VSNAEDALVALGQSILDEAKRGNDLAEIMLASPPAAEAEAIRPQEAMLPALCADPVCDHLTLRCPNNRLHTIGGHRGNRTHLISRGSTEPPKGSNQPRGRAGR